MNARVPLLCLGAIVALMLALGVAPVDRETWALESAPLVLALVLAAATFRRFRFSDRAYVQATALFALHAIGAHYTYSLTPIGAWVSHLFGAERNHYDRFVHFAFGVLFVRANRELFFAPPASAPLGRQLVIAVALVTAWGALYEIGEWLTAILVDPGAGTAFLGTQGDPWDAQKDLGCDALGAVLGAALEGLALRRPLSPLPSPPRPSAPKP